MPKSLFPAGTSGPSIAEFKEKFSFFFNVMALTKYLEDHQIKTDKVDGLVEGMMNHAWTAQNTLKMQA